jgi:hypothetical protein
MSKLSLNEIYILKKTWNLQIIIGNNDPIVTQL